MKFVVSAGYVGSRGLFLPLGVLDLNQLPLSVIASNGSALCVDTADPKLRHGPEHLGGNPAGYK